MAVVVQHKTDSKDSEEIDARNNGIYKIKISTDSTQRQEEEKETDHDCCLDKHRNHLISYTSSVASADRNLQSWTLDGRFTNGILDSFSNSDEEIIGIITMEDVLEQLLQEPIFDETDEYVDVHNRIRISMIPAIKSVSDSPRAVSAPHSNSRSSVASPLSSSHKIPTSHHHTSILRSSIWPNTQSPVIEPTLSPSTGKGIPSSSAASTTPARSSPSHRVSSKSYEKLKNSGHS